MAQRRVAFTVSGVVQGVSFRYFSQAEAAELGLVGWVRNRRDGAVEGEAEGHALVVDEFVKWLRHGPPSAHVTALDVKDVELSGGRGFEIRH